MQIPFSKGLPTPEEVAEKTAYAEKVALHEGILNRMHALRKTLCRVNCKALLHRPACMAMKKDIEYLKEVLL